MSRDRVLSQHNGGASQVQLAAGWSKGIDLDNIIHSSADRPCPKCPWPLVDSSRTSCELQVRTNQDGDHLLPSVLRHLARPPHHYHRHLTLHEILFRLHTLGPPFALTETERCQSDEEGRGECCLSELGDWAWDACKPE